MQWGGGTLLENRVSALESAVASRAKLAFLGDLVASSETEALGKAYDAVTTEGEPVIGAYGYAGVWMFMVYKYSSHRPYGMMVAMRFDGSLMALDNINGTKRYYRLEKTQV